MDVWGLTWLHFTVLILASFRLTHLIVYDKITLFLRNPFLDVNEIYDENGEVIQTITIKGKGIRYWIGYLLSCYWCVGVWSTGGIVLLFWWLPASYPFILILAVAGAAAIIESLLP